MEYKRLGEYIKNRRQEVGLIQSELGKAVGVTWEMISRYERAKTSPLRKLDTIAKALNTTLSDLVGDTYVKSPGRGLKKFTYNAALGIIEPTDSIVVSHDLWETLNLNAKDYFSIALSDLEVYEEFMAAFHSGYLIVRKEAGSKSKTPGYRNSCVYINKILQKFVIRRARRKGDVYIGNVVGFVAY